MGTYTEQQQRQENLLTSFASHRILQVRVEGGGRLATVPQGVRAALHAMARDIVTRREGLAPALRYLAERLEQEAARFEVGRTINTVGVVQGQGSEVDRLIGELSVLTDAFHMIADAVLAEAGIVDLSRPTMSMEDLPKTYSLVVADLKLHPQSTVGEIAERLSVDPEKVRRVLERSDETFARYPLRSRQSVVRWGLAEDVETARVQ